MIAIRQTARRQQISGTKSIKSKQLSCQFIGSFFSLDKIPHDPLPQIALAGRSNVGKSSLLNKLVGRRKMAKVSRTPGKTRSINFFKINERFHFVDLPGYGYAKVSKQERAGWGQLIEDYLTKSEKLTGLVLLLDCRRELNERDVQLIDWLTERRLPVIIALTKSDKLTRDKLNRQIISLKQHFEAEIIPFSVVSGVGKHELLNSAFALVTDYYQHRKMKG